MKHWGYRYQAYWAHEDKKEHIQTWPSQQATSQRREAQPAVQPGPETLPCSLNIQSISLCSHWSFWSHGQHRSKQRNHRGPLQFHKPPAWPPQPRCRSCWDNWDHLGYWHVRHRLRIFVSISIKDIKIEGRPGDAKVEPVGAKDAKDKRKYEGEELLPPFWW